MGLSVLPRPAPSRVSSPASFSNLPTSRLRQCLLGLTQAPEHHSLKLSLGGEPRAAGVCGPGRQLDPECGVPVGLGVPSQAAVGLGSSQV